MTCREVEEKLPAFVDGVADAHASAIASHLDTCDACAALARAQATARTVLKARAAQLSPGAPPGLRSRIVANMPPELAAPKRSEGGADQMLGWTGRFTAFAAAAMVVLTLGAILLPVATVRSTALLAAQFALDHLKCFTIEGEADGQPITKEQAEATLRSDFDLTVAVPPSLPQEQLELLAVRRCLYGDGRAAHLMYRLNGEPLSLFVVPGLVRPAEELSLFGHEQVVWTAGERTYMLVASAGSGDALTRVASYLRNEAK